MLLLVLAAHPAKIDAPECSRVAVGELCQCLAFTLYHSQVISRAPILFGEAYRRAYLVTQAHAFLFIRIDLVTAPGGYILQTEQVAQCLFKRSATVFAQVEALTIVDRMQVATVLALLCPACGNMFIFTHGQNDAIDQVARAFMIDNRARAKFGNSQKSRS